MTARLRLALQAEASWAVSPPSRSSSRPSPSRPPPFPQPPCSSRPLPTRRPPAHPPLLGLRLLVLVLCAVNLTFEIVGSSLILAPPLAEDVACALSRTKCRAAARRVPWAPGRMGWPAAQSEGQVTSGVRAGARMRAREDACARGCARARMCAREDARTRTRKCCYVLGAGGQDLLGCVTRTPPKKGS